MLLAPFQRLDRPAALGSVADGPDQQLAVDVSLHQIVLSAGANGPHGQSFIIVTGEHDDRNLGRLGVGAHQGVEPVGVGEREIQQHDVERVAAQAVQRGRETVHLHHSQVTGPGYREAAR